MRRGTRSSKGSVALGAAGLGAAAFLGLGCGIAAAEDSDASTANPVSAQNSTTEPRQRRTSAKPTIERTTRTSDTEDTVTDRAAADDAKETAGKSSNRSSRAPADSAPDDSALADDGPAVPIDDVEIDDAAGTESNPIPAPVAAAQLVTATAATRREYDAAESVDAAAQNAVTYTDKPTFFDQIVVASLYVMRGVSSLIGVDIYGLIGKVLENRDPPWFVKTGLDVRRTEYPAGGDAPWEVWEFHPPNPTGKTVIAIHGGGFIVEPLVTHWLDYAQMARTTGATVLVPMYPLAKTDAGTAVKVVPAMAQFIADHITARGSENVSVYADSAGPSLAMAAVRELVLAGKPVPASMVLLSFAPDASLSNPAIYDVKDPIIDVRNLDFYTGENHWGDGLDRKDPMVSPLFIEDEVLAALPPSTIYVGELEWVLPDTLLLHDKWSAAGGAVSTVVGRGQFHDWALGGLSVNSAAPKVRRDIYRQLGLIPVNPTRPVTLRVA